MSNLKTVTLNGVSSATAVPELKIRRVDRDVLGEVREVRSVIPGRAGSWAFDEEPGDRVITLVGWLQADGVAAKRTALHNLSEWLAEARSVVSLTVSDESGRYYQASLDDWRVDTADRYPSVQVTFNAGPYGLATSDSTHTEAVSGAGTDSGTFSVTDEISAEPVIEITPTNGTLTGFTLTVNGQSVTWEAPPTIASGDTITVSSISDTVTIGVNADVNLTGAFDPLDVSMLSVTVSVLGFPELVSGSNSWSLSWSGTATTITLEFTWRERFL